MYCVKCGVELADSERKCPLCQTPVYFPGNTENDERPYPEFIKTKDEISPRGLYFIISFLFLISAVISVVCDLSVNAGITFSGLVIGGLILAYCIFFLPGWFRRPSPAVFVPVNFAVAGLYLFYINIATGGVWFWSFALPVLGFAGLVISAVVILMYYLRCGYLYILGGMSIALGIYSVFVEVFIHVNFAVHDKLVWSIYPCITLFLIGIMLIVIAIVRPFRESLRKIFMI